MNHESIELPPDKSANLRRVTAGKQWQFSRVRSVIKCIANGEVQRVGVNPMDVQLVLLGENRGLPLRCNGFLLSKEVQRTGKNRVCRGKIKAGLQSVSSTVQALTINVLEERMTVGPILSASDAPEGYRPFKCLGCGLEGMAAPVGRIRKFCYAPCKASEAGNTKKKAATKARKQARQELKASLPAPHSKTCTKCGETKAVSEFNKATKSHDGLNSACRACRRTALADYDAANKEAKVARDLKRRTNPDSRARKLAQSRMARAAARQVAGSRNKRVLLHDAHVEVFVQFNLHDGHVRARVESRRPALHDAHVRELKSDNTRYVKWKYHNVPRQMLYHRIKRWMHKHLGNKLPSRKWAAKLGYTTEELRVHLERQFSKGMTWENKGAWHIDHILPVASFEIDSMDSPDFLACFGLHNLRPMWGIENIKKGAKREYLL